MIATVVDVDALLKVVWVSLAVGIGVCAAFSFAVLGVLRAGDARRAGRTSAMVPWCTLAVLGALVCGLALWRGYLFVVDKG